MGSSLRYDVAASSCPILQARVVVCLVICVTFHSEMMTHKAADSVKITAQLLRVMMQF